MADEDELLKAAADDIYRQLADNPDMVDFLGLPELPPELADGDGSEFLAVDEDGNHYYAG